ncbi:MAG: diguanylate cyclase [Rhodospirillales bacterium]
MSIGVASYKPGDDVEGLSTRADKAMYAAKHGGKNLVVSDNDTD